MKLYAISGLGADERVFQYLKIEHEIIPIPWLTPIKGEPIEAYAKRMAEKINKEEEFGILGVSFGGLVAVEMSKVLKPKVTVLISSTQTKEGLRSLYKMFGKTGINKMVPTMLFDLPRGIAKILFGTRETKLLNDILNDTDNNFTKWAVNELINWKNEEKIENCIQINGTKDKLIPPNKTENQILIEGGEHFMIVDKANEISNIINNNLKDL
jgi:esterase/lipase